MDNTPENDVDVLQDMGLVDAPKADHPEGREVVEWLFTNDKTNPAIVNIFRIFHNVTYMNSLGVMHAKNKETGEVSTILVGVDIQPDGSINTWPLAKVLTPQEQNMFLSPDGEGGWIGENETEH